MIKFFRKIRQKLLKENKFSKYMLYAIGEIILVVIGILIALQINNWNEQRKSKLAERSLFLNIIKDLDNERVVLENQLELSKTLKISFRNIYEYTSGKTEVPKIDNPALLFQSFNFNSLMIQNHEKSVDKISSNSLRSKLNEYLLLVKELSIRREEEVQDIEDLRRPFFMEQKIINIDRILYDQTELSSVDLSAFLKAKDSKQYIRFIASGYSSNQALIFYTIPLIEQNKELKKSLENSTLLNND